MRCRADSIVAAEENRVRKDASGEDQGQTANGQDERIEEDWIEPEKADAAEAGEKEKHRARNESGLNLVDDPTGGDESDGRDVGMDFGE